MADGAQYQIDIMAQAIGAEATDAQITGLANAIDHVAKTATPFDTALAAAESRLATAASASANAAAALQEAENKFSGLEREAVKAGKAVERSAAAAASLDALRAKADEAASAVDALAAAGQTDALEDAVKRKSAALSQLAKASKLAGAQDKLQAQAQAAAASLQVEAVAVDNARVKAAAAATEQERLAASLRSIKTAANQAASAQSRLASRTDENKAKALQLLSQTSPMLGRYAELAKGLGKYALAALAAVAAVVLVIGATVALAAAIGGAVVGMIKFALANDKIQKQRMDKVFESARKSIKGLFEGVRTGPLVNAAERLGKLLDKNTATGAALKKLVETLLNPLIAAAEFLAPLLGEMFKGFVYGALQAAIVVAKVRIAILKAIPKEVRADIKELIGGTDGLAASFTAGKVVFLAVAVVLGAIAAAALVIGIAILIAVAATAAFVAGIVALSQVGTAIGNAIVEWAGKLKDWASGAVGAAADFVAGLVSGIKAGVGAVADAAKSLAKGALDAVKSTLGIASPSKLAFEAGGFTAEGLSEGMADGEGDVRDAAERMVSPVDAALRSSAGSAPSVSSSQSTSSTTTTGGSNTYSITIVAPSGDAEDIAAKVRQVLQDIVDGAAIQMGAGGQPA